MPKSPLLGSPRVTRYSLLYLAILFTVTAVPMLLVANYGDSLGRILNTMFISSLQEFGLPIVNTVAIAVAIGFYWLKLKFQPLYGAIEIFIANLTISTALASLARGSSETSTFLQLFGGIYILIRGMDNIEKSLKARGAREIWDRFFSPPVIGFQLMIYFLFISVPVFLPNKIYIQSPAYFVIFLLQSYLLSRVAAKTPST